MKKIVAILAALCMLLSCASAFAIDQHEPDYLAQQMQLMKDNLISYWEEKGEGDIIKPYDEPITVHVVNYYGSTVEANMATWNEWWGETLENNRFIQACRDILNIDIQYDWLVNSADSGYVRKMRMEMAAGNLPDVWLVTDQTDLLQLAANEQIIPVDDIIKTTMTQEDQDIIYSDGGRLVEMASYEGQCYGIPRNISDTDTFSYIWLRKDWMEKLNLEAPKTMEDLKAIMDAFMAADFDGDGEANTYGMIIDKDLYYGTRGLFAAFNARPEFWVEKDGGIAWGGVQPEIKDALSFLHDLYEGGYLDKEFITQTNGNALGTALAGKAGVLYAGHWVAHNLQTMLEAHPEAEWECVLLPSKDGEPVTQLLNPVRRGWVVINANYDHPEIVGKISALCSFAFRSGITNGSFWFSNDGAQDLEPFQASVSSWDNYDTWLNLLEAFESGDESVLRAKAITYWANFKTSSEWAWMHMFGPDEGTPMQILADAIDNDRIAYDAFLGPQSEYMQDRWSAIKAEQLAAYIRIIRGEDTVDEGFDAWLKNFDSMGGARITEEANEWYRNK